jgi:polysaccharide biosynthesis protein PslH
LSRILFLSQLLPYPANAGPKVRIYHVLRHLSRRHQVVLLAFTRPDDPPEAVAHLEQFCSSVFTVPLRRTRRRDLISTAKSFLSGRSFIIQRDYHPEMASQVRRLLNRGNFDAVHADQLWMAQYAVLAKKISPGVQLVLDEHNACFQVFQRLAAGESHPLKRLFLEREWRKLRDYEAKTCAQFDQVVTVSEEDRRILEGLSSSLAPAHGRPTPHFTTIPICVDVKSAAKAVPTPGSLEVLHLGTMFWLPNVEGVLWFARQVWQRILEKIPQAGFTIVGKNPPNEIQKLGSINYDSRISVAGYAADPQPYLDQAGVFIVPLLSGGGMRVKILDAWAWGLPIVSTRIGAEGIKYEDGENILIADEPQAFADAVVLVLCDAELAKRLRENGRRWVEENYDASTVYSRWDEIHARTN